VIPLKSFQKLFIPKGLKLLVSAAQYGSGGAIHPENCRMETLFELGFPMGLFPIQSETRSAILSTDRNLIGSPDRFAG
jgi:hypothetical protein